MACETFHADVHAGNLWVLRDGRIGYLDFGRYFSCYSLFVALDSLSFCMTLLLLSMIVF